MRPSNLKTTAILTVIAILTSCSPVDIDDEIAVMKDIQGTWAGQAPAGNIYRHIKVTFNDNQFYGWMQTTDSTEEPVWTILPTESGTFSLSSVQKKTSDFDRYRSLNFAISGRCCGDNSLTAKTLSEMIIYENRKGLLLAGNVSMKRLGLSD